MNLIRHFTPGKLLGTLLIVLLGYFIMLAFIPKKKPSVPIPTVITAAPRSLEMVEKVTQTGTTVAFNSVNLVARIEGYLTAIEFTDGTFVKKDDELFVIQPEPYMEQWKAAKASVAAQKAMQDYAKIEYARQQRMFKENATSLNNVQKWLAKTLESQAELDKAIANEAIAAINYSYTHVHAPFDGRMGRHLIDVGNLVGNGKATDLATIEQIDPLYIYFNLNELDLIRLRAVARARGFKSKDINTVPVEISMQTDNEVTYPAQLDFINTGLNAATGTMELRALMDNKRHDLVPGLFVQVRVPLGQPKKQLTIPDIAVLYDQIGPYLLTVNAKNQVELRRVNLGGIERGLRAITQGIKAEDRVIIEGLQNATPGNQVNPTEKKSS